MFPSYVSKLTIPFQADKTKQYTIPGHSVPIAALGGFILFLGFLAFNGGSQLAIVSDAGDAAAVAIVFMNTILGGAGGAIAALGTNWVNHSLRKGKIAYWSLLTCINGGLAGMVALCAGCNVLHPGAAFAIGIIGGFTMYWVSNVLKRLGVDDPLGKHKTQFLRRSQIKDTMAILKFYANEPFF